MAKAVGWVLFIAIAALLLLSLSPSTTRYASISLDEFATRLLQDRVRLVVVQSDRLVGEFGTAETMADAPGGAAQRVERFQVALPPGATQDWRLTQWLLENRRGATIHADASPHWLFQVIIPLIPWLLIFGFIWFFVFRNLRKMRATDPNAPRPVYIVPAPSGEQGGTPPPSMPAPGGDN